MPYIDVTDYPESYDISTEEMELVTDWFNLIQERCDLAYASWHDNNLSEGLRQNAKLANDMYHHMIDGAREVLAVMGYMLEHDWVNHEDTYFFATKADAEAQNAYYQEQIDAGIIEDEELSDGIPGDCGC